MMKIGQLFAKQRPRPLEAGKPKEWKNIEYFDPVWEDRVALVARMIQCKGRLVDYGCGRQHLRNHLPPLTQYVPVDYTSRSPDTIVADFNQLPYPDIDGEIAFISGFLEYMQDAPAFIRHIKKLSYQEVVLSYCCVESVGSLDERAKLGWKNHLSLRSLLSEFLDAFNLHQIGSVTKNTILRFERKR
jgi:hypothetical protein